MPPLPRPSLPLTARLLASARALAREHQLRALATLEELGPEIDPAASYPEAWLRFRLLPDHAQASTSADDAGTDVVTGADLLADLDAMSQALSEHEQRTAYNARRGGVTPPGDAGPVLLTARALIARWKASAATLMRLRARGLVARRVVNARGRSSLGYALAHVEAFERAHPALIARSGVYERLTEAQRARFLAAARRYRAWAGLSLSAAAKRIATRAGRSHEGVRQLLLAHAEALGFPDASPLNHARRRAVDRAHRMGIDVGRLARLTRRSRSAVRRALALVEADRLRDLLTPASDGHACLAAPLHPHAASTDADPLALAPARTGLGAPGVTDLLALLTAARKSPPPLAVEERARAAAYHHLRALARLEIGSLGALHPSPAAIDRATTALRWASRLKAELIRAQLRVVVETLESRSGRPLVELPPPWVARAVRAMLDAAGRTVDGYEPWKGGRLAGPMTLSVDRAAARLVKEQPPEARSDRPRAATMLVTGTQIPDWTRSVSPWQRWLEPDARVVAMILAGKPTQRDAELLCGRFGLSAKGDATPPMTLAQLGERFSISSTRVPDALDAAIARALTQARAE